MLYFWHSVANKVLTLLSNMFTNLNLTDMEVCYKVFRREVIQGITLKSDRFGFEPEVTAKVARFKMPRRERRTRGVPDLRDAGQLPRPDLPGGQEDRHQGRLPGPLLHHPLRAGRLTRRDESRRIDHGPEELSHARRITWVSPCACSALTLVGPLTDPAHVPARGTGAAASARARRPSRGQIRPKTKTGRARLGPRRRRARPASTWAGRSPT